MDATIQQNLNIKETKLLIIIKTIEKIIKTNKLAKTGFILLKLITSIVDIKLLELIYQ